MPYYRGCIMSRSVSYQIRLSDDEKNAAFSVFRELGITPASSDAPLSSASH